MPVEVYAPRGLNAAGKAQAQRLAVEAEKMLAFYVKFFGVPANGPFRIISTEARQLGATSTEDLSQNRDSAFSTVGAVLLDDSVFRRDVLDLGTIEFLAQAAARSWIDGQVLLRGRGLAYCAMPCQSISPHNIWAIVLEQRSVRALTIVIEGRI